LQDFPWILFINRAAKVQKKPISGWLKLYFCTLFLITGLQGMPILREINIAGGIRAGIWQITESAEELLTQVNLSGSEKTMYSSFHNELRKKHWLAYRSLLKQMLDPASPDLLYDQNGKPNLISGSHHISVSHAGDFAAVVCSDHLAVGIDIEQLKDRVERVKERFLGETEIESIAPACRLEQLYVYWGGKEALYKLNGRPDVDFRNDIYIHPFDYLCNTKQYTRATVTVSGVEMDYSLWWEKVGDYMLVVAY
jgi:phosphopantetheinyl transferase